MTYEIHSANDYWKLDDVMRSQPTSGAAIYVESEELLDVLAAGAQPLAYLEQVAFHVPALSTNQRSELRRFLQETNFQGAKKFRFCCLDWFDFDRYRCQCFDEDVFIAFLGNPSLGALVELEAQCTSRHAGQANAVLQALADWPRLGQLQSLALKGWKLADQPACLLLDAIARCGLPRLALNCSASIHVWKRLIVPGPWRGLRTLTLEESSVDDLSGRVSSIFNWHENENLAQAWQDFWKRLDATEKVEE